MPVQVTQAVAMEGYNHGTTKMQQDDYHRTEDPYWHILILVGGCPKQSIINITYRDILNPTKDLNPTSI